MTIKQVKTGVTEHIPLGSGDFYIMDYTGTIPADEALEVAANMIGGIKGGAKIGYTPTFFTVKDDARRISETIITGEEAVFTTGYLKWKLGDLAKLALSGRHTVAESNETLEIGGVGSVKKYVGRFVHTLSSGKKIRITFVGVPAAGFELAFSPESETVINAEFSAQPFGENGCLIKMDKEL